jgi:hypothetical protein
LKQLPDYQQQTDPRHDAPGLKILIICNYGILSNGLAICSFGTDLAEQPFTDLP